ncbi:hypothetical protein DFH11DRAFT_1805964 [Phellopilus nigrolimitatus]|nr:hypothetical protein DFH11DRAFT_1805964 [Phellopilus nigrolimitatus]
MNGDLVTQPQTLIDVLLRDIERTPALVPTLSCILNELKKTPYTIYGDEAFDVVAIVSQPEGEVPVLTKLLASRNGVLNSVIDNVFAAIRRDHRRLFWTARTSDDAADAAAAIARPGAEWHFERADGSFTREGRSLLWCGIQNIEDVEKNVKDLEVKGRIERAYLPVGPSAPPHRAPPLNSVRSYSTFARRNAMHLPGSSRGYATTAAPTSTEPKRLALIGARGYTGRTLTGLLSGHPHLDLTHVSSRQLAGSVLDLYTKHRVEYSNLSAADVQRMEEAGEVDAWVMALPNGAEKPFVDAVDSGAQRRAGGKGSVVVDLSADYRFEDGWTYGLPELYGRSTVRRASRIANPGCYATSAQLLLGPRVKAGLVLPGVWPTVFGLSGYSGAGTVAGAQDAAGRRTTEPKVSPAPLHGGVRPYALTDHIHEREAGRHLATLLPAAFGSEMKVAFVPSVAPWFSGILSVLSAPPSRKVAAREVKALYEELLFALRIAPFSAPAASSNRIFFTTQCIFILSYRGPWTVQLSRNLLFCLFCTGSRQVQQVDSTPLIPKVPYLATLYHNAALCDHCMDRIKDEWFRYVYCAKNLCDVCENLDAHAHDRTHFFYVFKAPVDMQIFRIVAELDNPEGSPPVLNYPLYYS